MKGLAERGLAGGEDAAGAEATAWSSRSTRRRRRRAAVKAGTAPVALIIPRMASARIRFRSAGASSGPAHPDCSKDSSDMVAPQVVSGLLQKVAMTSMPDIMAEQGSKYFDRYAGGLTRGTARSAWRRAFAGCASGRRVARSGCGQRQRRRDHCGDHTRGGRGKQEQSDGVVLCGGDRGDVPAVHGERRGGSACWTKRRAERSTACSARA